MQNKSSTSKQTMKLHHVGIVVSNIETSIKELSKIMSFDEIRNKEFVRSQKVNVCFLQIDGIFLELIDPATDDSPVSNFIKSGGGIHHLCFEVKNIYEKIEELKKAGATVIVKPVKGFENRLIAFLFLNMKNTNCNLIELAEERHY